MNITLVTTSFNDEVHGTFNDKKTGCGINLLKPENVTRYRRGEKMTDLGEITCERCKTKIAKEMIKSDQKEMKAILKEERMKAKKGIEDEGIIPLGNTTAKITSAQNVAEPEPEPVPEPPKPAYQANGAPALDNDLAKFAIKKPDENPEPPAKNEFVLDPPKLFDDEPSIAPQPEAEPIPDAEEDDFLAQFAIQKPDEPEDPTEETEEDDFLAQFAVSAPHKQEIQTEEPETPLILDDISAALSAMEHPPINTAPKDSEPMPESETSPASVPTVTDEDDIMKMFAIGAPPQQEENAETVIEEKNIVPSEPEHEPVEEASVQNFSSEWDLIANQLFGETSEFVSDADEEKNSSSENTDSADITHMEVPKAPVLEDIAPVKETAVSNEAPVIEEISAPILDDIKPAETPKSPVLEDIAPVKETAESNEAPVIEEISVSQEEENERPILEDIVDDDDELELISEFLEPKAPVFDNISDAISAINTPVSNVSPAVPVSAPVQSAPVLSDISAALSALNAPSNPIGAVPVQPTPVSPVPVQPVPTLPVQPIPAIPTQPATPAPTPIQPTAPTAGAVGQVISVPQLTGYNDKNQPIYTYVQMQIQGYDKNGQPILIPLPGQNIPVPNAPVTFSQTFNQNTRLRDAVAAAKEIPTSAKDMTPGQRIAAAEAAKGSPLSANVSKIATNPHARSTSQAFISAISVSKEYANQSLTETQGLKQRTGVLNSVEDVLSQLGDNSLKEKKLAEAKAQSSIPAYQEYKAPARTSSYSPKPAAPTAPTPPPVNNRPLTKAELKAKKKQEKIDAKFQKEMSKRK